MPAGGCLCGNIRYEVQGKAEASVLCHCFDCRKISGSTYSSNAMYSEDKFKITQGTPKQYKKTADSGKEITSFFCGDCGSTMWRQSPSFAGQRIIKACPKAGTLDDTSILDNFKTDAELFTQNRPKWIGAQEGAPQN
ncbi:hypothetical protein ACJQWK_03423 [Exserohilum turcicum]|uniref:CENP-V/GFA domain-containing protein n=1 Tax=Exserohilum turcicum (strain 28A) TaxID=671987 RepID=R0J4G4_EXST2|nr:uncharacterized protein SETTUDRAFT_85448 [Exserohilum turcica Et28A]EOA91611.1 hypothetical protein SETTUDRAFT_85448 [Exserohilum turcica Et28A]